MDVRTTTATPSSPLPTRELPLPNAAKTEQHINVKDRHSRLYFCGKFVQTIILRPITTTARLSYRTVKLLTWVPVKACLYTLSGYHTKSAAFSESEYLNAVKAVRDILFIPSVIKSAFKDIVATREIFVDDIERKPTQNYLKVDYTKGSQQLSSYLHGCGTFEVIYPEGITEFAATTDADLKTIMASHLFKPDMMAINFGTPNVATFVTEGKEDGSVQTIKVDAKSLYRAPMGYHATNGKIQSGVFLVPTNLPEEALLRFKKAAEGLQESKDITCVNTNCRVLQQAGFSIEGIAMDQTVFPMALLEHLLFRNVFYTDSQGTKHKVHFDILNTTKLSLEKFFEEVDTAVVGTRQRHLRRNADTEENQKARGAAAQALIAQEVERLRLAGPPQQINDEHLGQRKVTVSVPSFLGNAIARFWGRHTMYEVDLSDRREEIFKAFQSFTSPKLLPFPQEKPSLVTRLKRDLFFSGPVIRFLRRHMMGRVDTIYLRTQDIFKYLKSTEGAHLNYVLLDKKMVLAMVQASGNSGAVHRKTADWALSKHALLAGRQEVYCSGEIWYDRTKDLFVMNDDSGTYKPSPERVKAVVALANKFFEANLFEAMAATEETATAALIQ